ncbi:MAG: hypothetical protein AB7F94_14560 [Nitrospira sp.]
MSHDEITVRVSLEDYATARDLVEEYAAALGVDPYFQNFAEEIANLFSIYGPPQKQIGSAMSIDLASPSFHTRRRRRRLA